MDLNTVREVAARLRQNVHEVVVGQDNAIDLLLVSLFSEGHILFEGVPGVAKTLLARTFAATLSLQFGRVQFTPDLMPGDIIGTNLFNFQTNQFTLTKGPIFTELLLADEINRTPPKTQAALLQAMQERSVTIDTATYELGQGFMVIATQNPIEQEGTYPLPEAQLDRFLFKVVLGYPIARRRARDRASPRPSHDDAAAHRLPDPPGRRSRDDRSDAPDRSRRSASATRSSTTSSISCARRASGPASRTARRRARRRC